MTETFKHGYALLIGVGECECQRLSLPVTVKDTQAIYAVLKDPTLCGYPEAQIKTLNNENATQQKILEGLQWLKEKAQADSQATIFIYYSGHGGLDENNNYYLIPHDYDPLENEPLSTALSSQKLTEALRGIQTQRLLVIIDSCHAAGMTTSKNQDNDLARAKLQNALKGLKGVPPSKGLIDQLTQTEGRAVFTACRGEQQSYYLQDESISIYTYHFLEALQGAGNKPEDTEVKLSNLMSYLSDAVPQTAFKECKKIQTPNFDIQGGDFEVAIARLRGGKGLPKEGWDGVKSEAETKINNIAETILENVTGKNIVGKIEGADIQVGDRTTYTNKSI